MNLKSAVLQIFSQRHYIGVWSLLGCWIAGLLLGVSFAFLTDQTILLMMCGWCYAPVSIVDLLFGCLFPLLLSAFAVYLNESWTIYPILFLKAFSFGLCGCAICRCFGTAGWLMSGLMQFSGCISSAALLHFALIVSQDRAKGLARLPWFAVLNTAIVLVDIYFIAPILYGALNG